MALAAAVGGALGLAKHLPPRAESETVNAYADIGFAPEGPE
jgi:hypothetical protein